MTYDRNQRILQQLLDDEAEAAADTARADPEFLRRGELIALAALAQLATVQRAVLDRADIDRLQVPPRNAVRPGLMTMARDALMARLAGLEASLGGQLVLQHRDLESMPDEDLRSLIEDIETLAGSPIDEPNE
jgi:hypothetical protein